MTPLRIFIGLLFLLCGRVDTWAGPPLAERCRALPGPGKLATEAARKDAPSAEERSQQMVRLIFEAAAAYRQRNHDEALDKLAAAYKIHGLPDIVFNMAQSCREAEQSREALRLYQLVASSNVDEALKNSAIKWAVELRRKLAQYDAMRALTEQQRALAEQQRQILEQQAQLAVQQRTLAEQQTLWNSRPIEKPQKPLHKRWWLWTAVGGAVVAMVIVGVATAYATPRSPHYSNLQLVNF